MAARSLMPDLAAGSVAGFTAEQVEEVRMVVRMFPIFLTTIFYWTIYSQVGPLGLFPPSASPGSSDPTSFDADVVSSVHVAHVIHSSEE